MMLETEVFQFEPDITGVSCAGRVAGPNDQVKRLFEITHTKAILAIDPDLVTSVKKLQAGDATAANVTA
ncbi:MAG: hypothetical protein ABSC64_20845 [Candidatus Korobacteraceae bacterium]|jgi:hypothetical protein